MPIAQSQGFFIPNEGRLFPPTEDNINSAKEGSLIIHFPWVQGALIPRAFRYGSESFENELHPVTGVLLPLRSLS